MGKQNGHDRPRQLVAQETARIIVTQGIRDYGAAKKKAAERLGLSSRGSLPGNEEIERAIEDYHQIFGGDAHADVLRSLRQAAIEAMELLEPYSPRLVGPVLNGTADGNSVVSMHAFSDSIEAVAVHLDGMRMPFRHVERRLKTRKDQVETFAGYEFELAGTIIQVIVFPFDGIRQAPLSPVDGKPMRRADINEITTLLG